MEVSGAVRPLKWSLGVKWLITSLHPHLLRELSAFAKDDTDMSFNAVSQEIFQS